MGQPSRKVPGEDRRDGPEQGLPALDHNRAYRELPSEHPSDVSQGGDRASEWAEAQHATIVFEGRGGRPGVVPTQTVPTVGVCVGFFPRCGAGEAKVWPHWMECGIRLQRVRLPRQLEYYEYVPH